MKETITLQLSRELSNGDMQFCDRFEIVIDPVALVRAIGHKAMRNRHGESRLQGGAVTVAAINVRREKAS